MFGTPKTEAGTRQIPLSSASLALIQKWRSRVASAPRLSNMHAGHVNVDTTLNVYTQVLDGSPGNAVETVGGESFTSLLFNPRSRARDGVKRD